MNHKEKILPVGKLPFELLKSCLEKYTWSDNRVVIGSGIGQDATVIDIGEKYLIAKTDPITFVTDEIGYYAIQVNVNDIACMGGTPRWFLATLLLPEGKTTEKTVKTIFQQISSVCRTMNIVFCGGHSEITNNLDRPIVIGQMLGEVAPENLISNRNIAIGDIIILTKGIAIEAVSIIAREKHQELKKEYPLDFLKRCRDFIHSPGIGVLNDARIAMAVGGVHGMHDPTEGGLATGLHELAAIANVGIIIYADKIPILPEARLLCNRYNLDVFGCIASGALLITAGLSSARKILAALEEEKIPAIEIGRIVAPELGIHIITADDERELPIYEQDEITRLF